MKFWQMSFEHVNTLRFYVNLETAINAAVGEGYRVLCKDGEHVCMVKKCNDERTYCYLNLRKTED